MKVPCMVKSLCLLELSYLYFDSLYITKLQSLLTGVQQTQYNANKNSEIRIWRGDLLQTYTALTMN